MANEERILDISDMPFGLGRGVRYRVSADGKLSRILKEADEETGEDEELRAVVPTPPLEMPWGDIIMGGASLVVGAGAVGTALTVFQLGREFIPQSERHSIEKKALRLVAETGVEIAIGVISKRFGI